MELVVEKTSSIFNSKNVPWAFLLALTIILSVQLIELFVLPINFFTFRVWEALKVKNVFLLPCPFYPNMTLSMSEEGVLGHHTEFALKKRVQWETDRYGYRRSNDNVDQYDIVVVGDSNIAGCGLTQEDMFTAQLENRSGLKAYPLSPEGIDVFLNSSRFQVKPPKVLIFETLECFMLNTPEIQAQEKTSWLKNKFKSFLSQHQQPLILYDRISKGIIFRYAADAIGRLQRRLLKRLGLLILGEPQGKAGKRGKMLFLGPDTNISQDRIDIAVRRFKTYKEALSKRGIQFVMLPIPNKETIYWQEFPTLARPVFLRDMIKRLKRAGIDVIDVEAVFESASVKNEALLYDPDDFHWNAKGVQLAVEETMKR